MRQKRKEVTMSKSPYENLKQIETRKQQLRQQIERQEEKLGQDFDLYQDDVETFKKFWSGVKGVRRFGQNISLSGVSQAVQTVRALPIGKAAERSGGKSGWLAAFALGAEVVGWIVKRRRNKKVD